MASLGGQLCSGIHSLSCQGRANTKLHPTVVKSRKCEVARASYDAQVQTSRREAITRLAIASGAALLSLVAATDAAHAAAGEIETAEEAASNPLIQSMNCSLFCVLVNPDLLVIVVHCLPRRCIYTDRVRTVFCSCMNCGNSN